MRNSPDFSLVTIVLFGSFFACLLLSFSTFVNVSFTLPKLIVLRSGATLFFLLLLMRTSRRSIQKPLPAIMLTVLAMGAWFSVSTLFATHLPTALHGYYGRYNGLLNQLLYLMMFLAIAHLKLSKPDLEKIVSTFVMAMVPVALYAIVQHLHLDPLGGQAFRPASTIGNPVVLAAVIAMAVPFSLYFLLTCSSPYVRVAYAAATMLFLAASAVTISGGPWVGTALAVLVMMFFYARGDRVKTVRVVYGGVVCLIAVTLFLVSDRETRSRAWEKTAALFSAKSDVTVSQRAADYAIALALVKDHPVTGTGFETFRNLYPAYRNAGDPNQAYNKVPTMVHNGYLQMLQSTGLPGAFLYLAFVSLLLRQLMSLTGQKAGTETGHLLSAAFLASIAGYLVQDISGWPELALTPLFWVMAGLAMTISGVAKTDPDPAPKYRTVTAGCAAIAALFALVLTGDAIVRWRADAVYRLATASDADGEWPVKESCLLRAVELMPAEALYADQLGTDYYRRYATSGDVETYKKSLRMFETALAANPFCADALVHALELDGMAFLRREITEPSALAQRALVTLPAMDKNNTDVYEAMTKLELGRRNFSRAEQYLEQALKIDGSKPSALVLAGDLCREQKQYAKAVTYYHRVKGSPLLVHARLAAASALFAQRKFPETLEEVNALLLLYPLEVRAILIKGDAYAALGNRAKALACYRETLDIDPANRFAMRALEQMGQAPE